MSNQTQTIDDAVKTCSVPVAQQSQVKQAIGAFNFDEALEGLKTLPDWAKSLGRMAITFVRKEVMPKVTNPMAAALFEVILTTADNFLK